MGAYSTLTTWYVRGTNENHDFDRSAQILPGHSFCRGCVVTHADPVGKEWHIEGPDVDTMLCGLRIELDDGAVRVRPAKNVCPGCLAAVAARGT